MEQSYKFTLPKCLHLPSLAKMLAVKILNSLCLIFKLSLWQVLTGQGQAIIPFNFQLSTEGIVLVFCTVGHLIWFKLSNLVGSSP